MSGSPEEAPPRNLSASERILRLSCFLQCLALGWNVHAGTSRLGGFLLVEMEWSAEVVLWVDRAQPVVLLLLAGWVLVRPGLGACLGIALVFLLNAVAGGLGHERFAHLTPWAHAVRFTAPLALLAILGHRKVPAGAWLRFGIAATFAAHGLEAWQHHPRFVDLLLAFEWRLQELGFGTGLGEAQARRLLTFIAWQDWILAAWIVIRPIPPAVFWMAIWGLSAALARPLQGGLEVLGEAGVRAANGLGPLALWWMMRETRNANGRRAEGPVDLS